MNGWGWGGAAAAAAMSALQARLTGAATTAPVKGVFVPPPELAQRRGATINWIDVDEIEQARAREGRGESMTCGCPFP